MLARRNWLPLCNKDSFISSLTSAAEADPQPKEHGLEYAISLCRQGQLHAALNFILSLYVRGVRPNTSAYAYIVQRCASMKSLLAGQRVHALIISDGLERDGALFGNLLVSMYGKCGTPDDARRVFNRMQHRDSQSWKTMVAAYAYVGHGKKACELLQRMLAQRVMPDNGTIINTLNACSSPAALEDGKLVHAHIVANDFLVDIAIKNALITMYGKCGSLDLACKVFADTVERDVVTWTAIITAFTKQGHGKEALQFFKQMLKESVKPDRVTFISTLEACASIEALGVGKLIHAQTIESGTESDVFVGTALLNMYGKCGCLYSAQFLFQKMRERNVVSWNAMITAYAQHRLCKEALDIFFQLQQDGLKVNNVTFINVLNACSRPADLVEGKLIHYLMVESGVGIQSDVIVGTALVSMYSECGSLDDAQRMFDLLINKNVVSWTALLSAHVEHGNLREALALFCQMQQEGVNPNHITFLTVLEACANPKVLAMGELIFSMIMENELKLDAFLSTTLVIMYSKCGKLEDARRVFTSIQQKTVVLFTAMIAAYAQFNHAKGALHMFEQMCREGLKPDEFTFSSILDALTSLSALMDGKLVHNLIIDRNMELESSVGIALMNMYGKCGALDDAHIVFDKMHAQNIVSFNAMIAAYAQHRQGEAALALYQRMQHEGMNPDHVTFISTLDACAGLVDLVQAKVLHVYLVESGVVSDVVVETALMNMYSKCGDFRGANKIFESLAKRDVASWNAMIAAYSQHGRGKEVVKLFKRMREEDIKPDEITFVSVLSACSHAGLINEGQEYFDSMSQVYDIEPTVEHYSCMADLYGRAGLLVEAENFLKKIPSHPSPVAWLTLLSACKVHGDVERAKHAADRIFELDSKHTGARMTLSNIYAVAGMWDDAANVIREIM